MNYASWIEEKRLKQGFIIATLISTIAGTFTTGINLYDRILEKRKQTRLDKGQDQKIRDLERRANEAESRSRRHDPGDSYGQRNPVPDDELRASLQRGGPAVQREYDRGYAQLGQRYAEGDVTAQLQLQSQLITLQSTVIDMLQEALVTGQPPDLHKLYNTSEFARDGVVRALCDQYKRMLVATVPASIGGNGARQRRPVGPVRRISSTPLLGALQIEDRDQDDRDRGRDRDRDRYRSTDRGGRDRHSATSSSTSTSASASTSRQHTHRHHHHHPRKPKALTMDSHTSHTSSLSSSSLFCPTAADLQRDPTLPLSSVLIPSSSSLSSHHHSPSYPPLPAANTCPTCHTTLLTPASAHSQLQQHWRIDKDVPVIHKENHHRKKSDQPTPSSSVIERRTYKVSNRFIVKCHRQGGAGWRGEYACYLCFCYRDRDTLCRDEEALIAHVSGEHGSEEYERDGDIVEVR